MLKISEARLLALPAALVLVLIPGIANAVPANETFGPVGAPEQFTLYGEGQSLVTGTYVEPTLVRDTPSVVEHAWVAAYNPAWTPPAGQHSDIFDYAMTFMGVPYVAYSMDPEVGFDCSGFTSYVYAHFGVKLYHDAGVQAWQQGYEVPESEGQLGDLVYMPGHIGFWAGPGWMLDAPREGKTVGLHRIWSPTFSVIRITG